MTHNRSHGNPEAGGDVAGRTAIWTVAFTLSWMAAPTPGSGQGLDTLVLHAVQHAKGRLASSVAYVNDSLLFPRSTLPDGRWNSVGPSSWTSGFFPGCLWYMYEITGDTTFRRSASRWTAALESQKVKTNTHDVGFIVFCSFGNAHRLHPDEAYRQVLLQAATSLASRYNATVGCTRSWDWGSWSFPVIIDNMMNLELLFWASKNGGPAAQGDIAVSHALKTITNHFRTDGGTYHVVDYNPSTGAVIWRGTHQGYADESVWSRGQAWALYGYTMAYRQTGDARFLAAAENAAGYFLDHLPADCVPYWDFVAPNIPNEERDASAAAIACSGLLELSTLSQNPQSQARYFESAADLLGALCKPPYLSEGTSSMGILNHAVGSRPDNAEVDVSLIYGDYYFLEALRRYMLLTGLPVTVTRFGAACTPSAGRVNISWSTLSEVNNYGFEIEKDTVRIPQQFMAIPGSFTPGHGTTSLPHDYFYTDTNGRPGRWSYRLKQIDLDGTAHLFEPVEVEIPVTTVVYSLPGPPGEVSLDQNYPNPFNPATTIRFGLPARGDVALTLYDTLGKQVKEVFRGGRPAGYHEVVIDASGLRSGVYFCRLRAGGHMAVRKLVLLR
jgi:hypothetical protein